ncbi:tetratricopeptide repeat protein [Nitratidesulfovibrio sp.]|uniref:tetratricopeptide repeat protein n=1 Tax=Nitratidesulfovibrio sp. TaxID=2802297 RepID=UPI0033408533
MPFLRPLALLRRAFTAALSCRALWVMAFVVALPLLSPPCGMAGPMASQENAMSSAGAGQTSPPLPPTNEPLAGLTARAKSGDPRAQLQLGMLHEEGRGVPQDLRRAEALYRQAIAKGDANAMNQLAVLIDSGRSSSSDRGEAVRLFRKAAEKGNGLAAYNLGLMLREGRGTRKDWPQAAYWLACADVLGEARAMKDLPPRVTQAGS